MGNDSLALGRALDMIGRTPEQEKLHRAATDIYDQDSIAFLRDLVHSDFAIIQRTREVLLGVLDVEPLLPPGEDGVRTTLEAGTDTLESIVMVTEDIIRQQVKIEVSSSQIDEIVRVFSEQGDGEELAKGDFSIVHPLRRRYVFLRPEAERLPYYPGNWTGVHLVDKALHHYHKEAPIDGAKIRQVQVRRAGESVLRNLKGCSAVLKAKIESDLEPLRVDGSELSDWFHEKRVGNTLRVVEKKDLDLLISAFNMAPGQEDVACVRTVIYGNGGGKFRCFSSAFVKYFMGRGGVISVDKFLSDFSISRGLLEASLESFPIADRSSYVVRGSGGGIAYLYGDRAETVHLAVEKKLSQRPPEGWRSERAMSRAFGFGEMSFHRFLETDEFKSLPVDGNYGSFFASRRALPSRYFSQGVAAKFSDWLKDFKLPPVVPVPEGWVKWVDLRAVVRDEFRFQLSPVLSGFIDANFSDREERRHFDGMDYFPIYRKDFVDTLLQRFAEFLKPPDGWKNKSDLLAEVGGISHDEKKCLASRKIWFDVKPNFIFYYDSYTSIKTTVNPTKMKLLFLNSDNKIELFFSPDFLVMVKAALVQIRSEAKSKERTPDIIEEETRVTEDQLSGRKIEFERVDFVSEMVELPKGRDFQVDVSKFPHCPDELNASRLRILSDKSAFYSQLSSNRTLLAGEVFVYNLDRGAEEGGLFYVLPRNCLIEYEN